MTLSLFYFYLKMIFLLIPFLIFIDLITKYLSQFYITQKINLIWEYFYLDFIYNTWIAFWLPLTWNILKIVTILIISVLVYYFVTEEYKKNNTLINLWFIFVISWALWNWYERIFNWKVIDFLWIKYFSIFNLADVFITFWVILYLIYLITDYLKNVWK